MFDMYHDLEFNVDNLFLSNAERDNIGAVLSSYIENSIDNRYPMGSLLAYENAPIIIMYNRIKSLFSRLLGRRRSRLVEIMSSWRNNNPQSSRSLPQLPERQDDEESIPSGDDASGITQSDNWANMSYPIFIHEVTLNGRHYMLDIDNNVYDGVTHTLLGRIGQGEFTSEEWMNQRYIENPAYRRGGKKSKKKGKKTRKRRKSKKHKKSISK